MNLINIILKRRIGRKNKDREIKRERKRSRKRKIRRVIYGEKDAGREESKRNENEREKIKEEER